MDLQGGWVSERVANDSHHHTKTVMAGGTCRTGGVPLPLPSVPVFLVGVGGLCCATIDGVDGADVDDGLAMSKTARSVYW